MKRIDKMENETDREGKSDRLGQMKQDKRNKEGNWETKEKGDSKYKKRNKIGEKV